MNWTAIGYRIGSSFAKLVAARTLVIGQDARLSSPDLADFLCWGILDQVDILDLGLCGTDELEKHLPFSFVKLLYEPDGTFPNSVPPPLLPEHRRLTSNAVLKHKANLGIAWDGYFDRCFLLTNATIS